MKAFTHVSEKFAAFLKTVAADFSVKLVTVYRIAG
jgi:hypothetical protein